MIKNSVIIVEDDQKFADKLIRALRGLFNIEWCRSEKEFRAAFSPGAYDLIIMDMRLDKDKEGLYLLKEVLFQNPEQAAIVMTAYADTVTYSDALAAGAITYLDKQEFSPILIARIVEAIVQQVSLKKQIMAMERRFEFENSMEIIGVGPEIRKVREGIQNAAANSDIPVLIVGASGTGKKLSASNIYRLSNRKKDGPLFHASCGRVPKEQLGNLIFGQFKENVNRSNENYTGWIDDAKGGILFLENVNDLDTQTLGALTFLFETGRFVRIGGSRPIDADVQVIISATDDALKNQGVAMLRSVIIERFSGKEIKLPPLQNRVEDLSLIANYTLLELHRKGRTKVRSFLGSAITALESSPWPGNVRELQIAIEYASVRADAAKKLEIGLDHLPSRILDTPPSKPEVLCNKDYKQVLAHAELNFIEAAIDESEKVAIGTLAEKLGYSNRFTFSRRVKKILDAHPDFAKIYWKVSKIFPKERSS